MLEMAKDIQNVCPDAWLLNNTNSMSIVTGTICALNRTNVNVYIMTIEAIFNKSKNA